MRNLNSVGRILSISCGLVLSSHALSIEYHGYFRSGVGASAGGADQQRFELPGAGAAFRLGNETDTYIETSFSQTHGEVSESKPSFKSHVRFAFKSSGHRDWEPTNHDLIVTKTAGATGSAVEDVEISPAAAVLALREAYAEAKNLPCSGCSIWIGKRFYMREDLHMLDYYLLDNAGPGFGVESIPLADYKLNLALTRSVPAPASKGAASQTNLDLRLQGLELGAAGKLTPVIIFGATGEGRSDSAARAWEALRGYQYALLMRQDFGGSMDNLLAVQYGTGLFGGIADWGSSGLNQWGAWGSAMVANGDQVAKKARDASSSMRIADQFTVGSSGSLSGQFVLVYETVNFGGAKSILNGTEVKIPNKSKLLTGVRPVWQLNENSSLAAEIGFSSVSKHRTSESGVEKFSDLNMTKYTIAQNFSPSANYWARPQLRFFATYAQWNDAVVNSAVYDDKAGWSIGSQVEAWW